MTRRNSTIVAGAIGALLACTSLIALALIARPALEMNHAAILSGRKLLSPLETASYLSYLRKNLTVDSFYLLGHIAMWLGFAALLDERGSRYGRLIAILGIMSGGLDFAENEVRWAIAGSLDASPMSSAWTTVWQVTVGMSFWAVLITTLLTAIMIWSSQGRDRIMTLIGLACLPGVCGIYYAGYLVTFLWMILWHGSSTVYLWQSAATEQTGSEAYEGRSGNHE